MLIGYSQLFSLMRGKVIKNPFIVTDFLNSISGFIGDFLSSTVQLNRWIWWKRKCLQVPRIFYGFFAEFNQFAVIGLILGVKSNLGLSNMKNQDKFVASLSISTFKGLEKLDSRACNIVGLLQSMWAK